MATSRNVRFVPIADTNHHLFSAVACVKSCYVYEQATWLLVTNLAQPCQSVPGVSRSRHENKNVSRL